MIQRNCKNCGSPLEHSYNHKCKYCGTLYDFNEPNKVELHSYDMVDLKFRGIEQDILSNSLLLYFEGYKLEAPIIYEYNDENKQYVSKEINYINPPKSYFFIRLDKNDLEKGGLGYLNYMLNNFIRPTELENVKRQILQNAKEFSRNNVNIWNKLFIGSDKE